MNTFDKVAKIYSNGRPGYPEEVYQIIDSYTEFSTESSLLEIGAGHGVASQEILDFWNPELTLIEPGSSLLDIAREQVNGSSVSFFNGTFDEFHTIKLFDGIFSATAFHWLDKSTKYKKASELLKENGFLILYWNNYQIAEEDHFQAIQKIYSEYHYDNSSEIDIRKLQKQKIIRKLNGVLM